MKVSVLIPTYNRVNALVATLTALCTQTYKDFEIVVSDQSDQFIGEDKTLKTIVRILELHGNPVKVRYNMPRKGIAQQRQFLLDEASGEYSLYMDDDVVLEPDVIERMVRALDEEPVGFCGMALVGLSYLDDVRPHQQQIEFWDGPVGPENVVPGSEEWERWPLHNAANILHVGQRLGVSPQNQKKYKVAWVGGCILYNTAKLRETGGFDFWEELPPNHCGEDVFAQHRLMKKYGGFGLLPSGAYHLELPTTIINREVNAPEYLINS
ncbi:glycosyltransferase [Mucilaginibacter sp. RS28]|uniref:Glycosyltransferase n=1 Tax=Mucilaginibacter straminoryzae TaxID=2932774 RepID=A0A9X2B977_9SPHI|nr:glycosyltransferase family 2 protein [Mucilaginibacter straminoryzae]MCJ8210329.1 glycosyltransferase [Mucilaginibacter straminoryzae]